MKRFGFIVFCLFNCASDLISGSLWLIVGTAKDYPSVWNLWILAAMFGCTAMVLGCLGNKK